MSRLLSSPMTDDAASGNARDYTTAIQAGQRGGPWGTAAGVSVLPKSVERQTRFSTQEDDRLGEHGLTTHEARSRVRVRQPVVPRRAPRRTFVATARWEGAIQELFSTYFVAEVIDLHSDERSSVEFDLAEVAPHDLALVEHGALFYWTVGYETKDSGQRVRGSILMFRRSGG